MKIAMFGHKRIPSREGGVEIVVEELAKEKRHSAMTLLFITEKVTTYQAANLMLITTALT